MQFSKFALVAAVAAPFAMAQDLSKLPSCALAPAANAISGTGCGTTDFKCICGASSFLSEVAKDIQTLCTPDEIAAVTKFAVDTCATFGITINPGGAPSGSSTAAPETTAMSSTMAASTTAAAATSEAPSSTTPSGTTASASPTGSSPAFTGAAANIKGSWVAGGVMGAAAVLAAF